MPDENAIGQRIVIWGVTGSGKTTLARRLGQALGLPVVELDAIRHRNGWDTTPWEEFRAELEATLDSHKDGWVLEGSYSRVMDIYLSRLDTMIWLRLPWRVTFSRLFQRTIARAWDKQPLYNRHGPTESWRMAFFDRRSILLWSISQHRRIRRDQRKRIDALPEHVSVHELGSARELDAFVKTHVFVGGPFDGTTPHT
jgi:adenylate kinase family enzyme